MPRLMSTLSSNFGPFLSGFADFLHAGQTDESLAGSLAMYGDSGRFVSLTPGPLKASFANMLSK